jgi:gliding motility-associated-like protein
MQSPSAVRHLPPPAPPTRGGSALRSRIRHLASGILLILAFHGYSQFSAGPDDTINPGVPVTLTSVYGLIGNGITITDDGVEGPFPIGFSFSYFGNIYTEFYVGANGWISFSPNPNAAGTRQAFAVPNAADYNPKNCILGPFQDLNPIEATSPHIFYLTIGAAPQRQLVVMWCQTPMYSCLDSTVTFQIVLNEGSNTIENQIQQKSSCPDWLGNLATQGLQNSTGYVGFAVPGRNATSWTARSEGWMYTPTSADSFQVAPIAYGLRPIVPGEKISYQWFEGNKQIGSTQSILVSPGRTTTYRAVCTLCSGQEFTDSVTVFVIPWIPNAFTPNGDGLNDVFRIIGLPPENITRFILQIYDRWGQLVFTTNDITQPWDGTMKGKPCPEGEYVWVYYYEDGTKAKVTNKGMVMVVR